MRSLQIRLPVFAIAIVAASLGVAAFAVFETLLITGNDRLDDSISREALEVREFLALNAPGALVDTGVPAPPGPELAAVLARYLEREDPRSDDHMTVARVGGQVQSTANAPTPLELLRERGELPAPSVDQFGDVVTVGTTEGDVRMLAIELRVADGSDASVAVLGSSGEIRSRAVVALGRIAAAAGVGLLLAGVLLALMMRRALRPLNELASAARVAELEDFGDRVEFRERADEVGQLAREFNRMFDRLESSVVEQRRFMASISHELRTPITIVRGHLDLVDAAGVGASPDEIAETLGLVRDELLRMQRLVADLMALGRSGEDDFVVAEPEPLREFFDDFQMRVVGLGVRGVRFEAVPDVVVDIDHDRLAQALLNLLSNADVHAPSRTATVVSARISGSWLEVTVADDGPGIDDAIRDRAFEPFVRSEKSNGSTGLGLSVVRAIATAHGGDVNFDSGATGSAFTVRLPAGDFGASKPPKQMRFGAHAGITSALGR